MWIYEKKTLGDIECVEKPILEKYVLLFLFMLMSIQTQLHIELKGGHFCPILCHLQCLHGKHFLKKLQTVTFCLF